MKKLKSTWYNMAIVLTAIAVVAGASLGYVNDITAPTIKALKEKQEKQAEQEVLAGQEGTAIKITDPKGFGGALTVMVGLAEDGTILGYKVLESSETPACPQDDCGGRRQVLHPGGRWRGNEEYRRTGSSRRFGFRGGKCGFQGRRSQSCNRSTGWDLNSKRDN